MKALVLFFLCLSLSSCMLGNALDRHRLAQIDKPLNKWIGQTKDQQIMKLGPPERCMDLQQGGEVCAWKKTGVEGGGQYRGAQYGVAASGGSYVSSWEHQVTYTYNPSGIISGWSYRGSLGQRTNEDANLER